MYTLDELNNRIIWLFRQPRSGSTWFKLSLIYELNRMPVNFVMQQPKPKFKSTYNQWVVIEPKRKDDIQTFFENRMQQPDDNKFILDTHLFDGLHGLKNYTNPIVIRVARKNVTEQFISHIVASRSLVWNIQPDRVNPPPDVTMEKYKSLSNISIDTQEVLHWITTRKHQDDLWESYSGSYESETVYYEDLLDNWQSNILPIQVSMGNNTSYLTQKSNVDPNINKMLRERPSTIKLPYDKREIIMNYDEVDSIIKNEFGDF